MPPDHTPHRSQVVLIEPALSQLAKLSAAETHGLDRVLVAISANPDLGTQVPDTLLRAYTNELDGVRVIYYVTALRQFTIVAYVEAYASSAASASRRQSSDSRILLSHF